MTTPNTLAARQEEERKRAQRRKRKRMTPQEVRAAWQERERVNRGR